MTRKTTWWWLFPLAWAGAGFLVLKLGCFRSDSSSLNFLFIFGVWWGVAFFLTLRGLRTRSSSGLLNAICILLLFTHFLWKIYPRVGGPHSGTARVTATQTQLANFRVAVDAFKSDTGFFPSGTNGLQALVRQPLGATNWRGPYLPNIPKDPWKHDFRYDCPGKHNPDSYDISCPGPPRGNIRISNWAE
jgi:general secretion pathway protein G